MKIKLALIICLVLFNMSCKKSESNPIKNTQEIQSHKALEPKNPTASSKGIKDCDDFLNTYETWANDFLALMAKHKDNPIELVSSPEYSKTLTKSTQFMQAWQNIALSCASNEHYSKRMKVIQQRLEKKKKELGLTH
ncbi:hypothetical protein [Seonamhaeicola sp.]|uniref:hypothetical protein n=1 Tax=Seonamhaeicola sp. TaxID=1912245 RepID=UPI00262C0532|nr:hypothetical protein [Seonamhaeicola sp.]